MRSGALESATRDWSVGDARQIDGAAWFQVCGQLPRSSLKELMMGSRQCAYLPFSACTESGESGILLNTELTLHTQA